MKFTEALDLYGIEWHPSETKEGEITVCCPFCVDQGETQDTKFRLGINIQRDVAHCFNCEWGSKKGTIFKVLDALKIKYVEATDDSDDEPKTKKVEFDGELPEEYEPLWPLKKDKDFRRAYHYLRSRRISVDQIRRYKIGFCLAGRYSYRIVFPVYQGKELCALITRDFTGKQNLRYLNSIGKKTLYGITKHKKEIALLIEGVFDKLAAERVLQNVDCLGIPGRVLKSSQIELLKPYKRVIRVGDNDGPGLNGVIKDCTNLQGAKVNVWFSSLSSKYEDISDAFRNGGETSIRALVDDAEEYSDFVAARLRLRIATDYRGAKKVHGDKT